MKKPIPNGVLDAVTKAGSQEQLAKDLNVAQQSISKWHKRGYMPLGRAIQVNELYNVPIAHLVDPRVLRVARIVKTDAV